jgi:acetyltransferase-like isoleucine patch superfamily enzyme
MPQRNSFIEWSRLIQLKVMKRIADILTPYYDDRSRWDLKNWWLRKAGIKIGEGVAIDHDFYCLTGLESNITIEDHAVIGVGLRVWNFNSVAIGAFSMFAADVTLANGGHNKNTFEPFSGILKIGKGCWIGNGARIIGSLNIGDNAIVAAGSVVVGDVPKGSIVAGVPAKVIGMRDLPNKVWHLGGIYFDPITFTIVE